MKRICYPALLLVMSFLLCSCGGKAEVQIGTAEEKTDSFAGEKESISAADPEAAERDGYVFSERIYTVPDGKTAGTLGELENGTDHGPIYPYVGRILYENYPDQSGIYEAGKRMGFFDKNGMLVTGPVYADISRLSYYDPLEDRNVFVPMYMLTLPDEGSESSAAGWSDDFAGCRIASGNGQFVSEENYGYVAADRRGVLCMEDPESSSFSMYDFDGTLKFTEEDILKANPGKKAGSFEWGTLSSEGDMYTVFMNGELYAIDPQSYQIRGRYSDSADILPADDAYPTAYGYLMYRTDESGSRYYTDMYDFDGKLLFSADAEIITCFDSCSIVAGKCSGPEDAESVTFRAEGKDILLYDPVTEKSLRIPDADYCYLMNTMEGSTDLPYLEVVGYHEDEAEFCLIDYQLNIVLDGKGYISPVQDRVTNAWYFAAGDEAAASGFTLYDRELNRIAAGLKTVPQMYDGNCIQFTDICTEASRSQNVFFRYVMQETIDE